MGKIKTINIFGSSGSGSTTLARAVAKKYGYIFIDTDDAIWEKTELPFSKRKSDKDAREYLEARMKTGDKIVISGSFIGWADDIKEKIDLFVYLNLPLEIRKSRIESREKARFGNRVLPGGDLYQKHIDFLEWISLYDETPESLRGKKQHEMWLADVKVPVVRITEPADIDTLVDAVEKRLNLS
ncbi:MAG TPA: shikimate kinase [Bacillota bacterium]|nr:shikimate kinase [Bacillota bacterium]HPJ85404.1 shikimate kinase [Bacillota bacterium]HPQ61300.1 shikimate kinase [Bacillota bacterium]HRX91932.1 shikimate kinase [Candidatus Izemoplasmatales bacterium]